MNKSMLTPIDTCVFTQPQFPGKVRFNFMHQKRKHKHLDFIDQWCFSKLFSWWQKKGSHPTSSDSAGRTAQLGQLFKLSWLIARVLLWACQALLDVLIEERRHATRFLHNPLNSLTVKTAFWRAKIDDMDTANQGKQKQSSRARSQQFLRLSRNVKKLKPYLWIPARWMCAGEGEIRAGQAIGLLMHNNNNTGQLSADLFC